MTAQKTLNLKEMRKNDNNIPLYSFDSERKSPSVTGAIGGARRLYLQAQQNTVGLQVLFF